MKSELQGSLTLNSLRDPCRSW